MSRNFLDTLKGFTPDGSGLDRDALLFEAGRASAPSASRAWLVAALLAVALTLTAGFLLDPPAPAPSWRSTPLVPSFPPSEGRPLLLSGELPPDEPALSADEMVPDESPLRPFDRSISTSLE
jgi:hypothetical protein